MAQTIKVTVHRKPQIKVKALVKFPANVVTENFLTVTSANGTYTFSIDYTKLAPGPITDPATSFVALLDVTAGGYREVSIASLLTSGLDLDLQAIAVLTGTGILVRTAANTWAVRTLAAPAAGITMTNADGVAGNPTFVLANDLAALESLAANGMAARTATDTWAVRTITAGASIGVTNGDGVAGNPTIAVTDAELVALAGLTSAADQLPYFTGSGTASLTGLSAFIRTILNDANATAVQTHLNLLPGTNVQAFDADLAALAANSGTGLWSITGAGTGSVRTITGPAAGITFTNGGGVAGNPTLALANDLAALEGLAATGFAARTATDTWAQRTIQVPAAGLTVSNPAGVAGDPTFALANDLAGVEGLATTGIVRRTATDTWSAGTVVSNTELATMAAFTFKANNTSGAATPTDITIDGLTLKASPAAGDEVIIWDVAGGALKKATVSGVGASAGVASLNGQTGAVVSYFAPQGRLTLQTGFPVMTTTQSAKTTLFYSAYNGGDLCPIYDGANIVPTPIPGGEISVATTDTTKSPAAIGASKVNDWFIWNDAGTIRIGHGPDWTSDTARSAGTALVLVKGILLNSVSITNGPAASRGTYVGTTRSNASSQLDWIYGTVGAASQLGLFYVWNAYNRIPITSSVGDSTSSWTYNSSTWRQVRASGANQIGVVAGLSEDALNARYCGDFSPTSGAFGAIGIGINSSSVASSATSSGAPPGSPIPFFVEWGGVPAIGVTTVFMLEATSGGTGGTFYGSGGAGGTITGVQQLMTINYRM